MLLSNETSESKGIENVFKNVFFDLNKSTLRTESRIELNLFANYLLKHKNIRIVLGGHTDSRGDESLNLKLSTDRAESVFRYLLERGVSAQRMTFEGYGSSSPIFSIEEIDNLKTTKEKKAAHQKNRRTVWRETF